MDQSMFQLIKRKNVGYNLPDIFVNQYFTRINKDPFAIEQIKTFCKYFGNNLTYKDMIEIKEGDKVPLMYAYVELMITMAQEQARMSLLLEKPLDQEGIRYWQKIQNEITDIKNAMQKITLADTTKYIQQINSEDIIESLKIDFKKLYRQSLNKKIPYITLEQYNNSITQITLDVMDQMYQYWTKSLKEQTIYEVQDNQEISIQNKFIQNNHNIKAKFEHFCKKNGIQLYGGAAQYNLLLRDYMNRTLIDNVKSNQMPIMDTDDFNKNIEAEFKDFCTQKEIQPHNKTQYNLLFKNYILGQIKPKQNK